MEKNNRSKDCIRKRAFVPEQEIFGTVRFLGKPAGSSKLLYDIEMVTSSVLLHGYNLGKDISTFLIVIFFVDVGQVFAHRANPFFSSLYYIGKLQIYLGLNKK